MPEITDELEQCQFESEMAIAPRNYFFSTMKEMKDNMNKRLDFLRVLEKHSLCSRIFDVPYSFMSDFVTRND